MLLHNLILFLKLFLLRLCLVVNDLLSLQSGGLLLDLNLPVCFVFILLQLLVLVIQLRFHFQKLPFLVPHVLSLDLFDHLLLLSLGRLLRLMSVRDVFQL